MSSYRSWEERQAAAQKDRAEAKVLEAQAKAAQQAVESGAAKTATDELAEQVKQARLRKQLAAAADDATEEVNARKQKRRDARDDNGTRFKTLVNVVMVLGLLAALPAQLSYFLTLHRKGREDTGPAWLMLPVPFFLELLAWVGVLGTQWAHRKGLPRWPFWILTAALASVAGYINLSHGAAEFGMVAGVALAATSVIGPVLAEVRQLLESKAAADPRSLEQRARDKAAAKKKAVAEQAEAERAAAEDARRAHRFPAEFAEYEALMIAHPEGAISRDEAWRQAWDTLHRLPLGVTAGTLAARVAAQEGIDAVMSTAGRSPESVAVELLLTDILGADRGDGGAGQRVSGRTPTGGAGGGSTAAAAAAPKGAEALGRKGNQASGRTAAKTPNKPLEPAHIEKVRKLAEALGDAERLSARKVREVIGGGSSEYAVRLRDAVKSEQQ